MNQEQLPYAVFRQLASEGVTLRGCGHSARGWQPARWSRNETAETSYILPDHHTLSLYIQGGELIRRRQTEGELRSHGAGSLCLMPEDLTTDWLIAGPVELFHLYIPRTLFDRAVVSALDRDPTRVMLPERTFFTDPMLEQVIRLAFLGKDWAEPAESLALSSAGHLLIAHLITSYSEVGRGGLMAKGGLPPRIRRRVEDYIDANLDAPIRISDLAGLAGLSEFHFAHVQGRNRRGSAWLSPASPHGARQAPADGDADAGGRAGAGPRLLQPEPFHRLVPQACRPDAAQVSRRCQLVRRACLTCRGGWQAGEPLVRPTASKANITSSEICDLVFTRRIQRTLPEERHLSRAKTCSSREQHDISLRRTLAARVGRSPPIHARANLRRLS